MTYRPRLDHVIILPEYETEHADGLIQVPGAFVEPAAPSGFDRGRGRDIAKRRIALSSRTCVGRVVAVGPGRSRRVEPGEIDDPDAPYGPVVPLELKVGARVVFERTAAAYLDDDSEVVMVKYEAVWLEIDDSIAVQTTAL